MPHIYLSCKYGRFFSCNQFASHQPSKFLTTLLPQIDRQTATIVFDLPCKFLLARVVENILRISHATQWGHHEKNLQFWNLQMMQIFGCYLQI